MSEDPEVEVTIVTRGIHMTLSEPQEVLLTLPIAEYGSS